jgi:hypothetical protein
MHPIVIMSYDKSPAIVKAIDILEEAGFEVRVLNTNSAKLADFLGALAGVDTDMPADKSDAKDSAADEVPADEDKVPADEDKISTEAVVNGEKVIVEIVDGSDLVLHSSKMHAGAKVSYNLGESSFSFWPDSPFKTSQEAANTPIKCVVELDFDGKVETTVVELSEHAMNPPVLKVGREILKNFTNN